MSQTNNTDVADAENTQLTAVETNEEGEKIAVLNHGDDNLVEINLDNYKPDEYVHTTFRIDHLLVDKSGSISAETIQEDGTVKAHFMMDDKHTKTVERSVVTDEFQTEVGHVHLLWSRFDVGLDYTFVSERKVEQYADERDVDPEHMKRVINMCMYDPDYTMSSYRNFDRYVRYVTDDYVVLGTQFGHSKEILDQLVDYDEEEWFNNMTQNYKENLWRAVDDVFMDMSYNGDRWSASYPVVQPRTEWFDENFDADAADHARFE